MRNRLLLLGACAIGAYYLTRVFRDLPDYGDLNDVDFGDEEDL